MYNPTRCREHLELGKCPVYKPDGPHELPDKKQKRLDFGTQPKHLIWREIGYAIFVSGRPFSLVEDKHFRKVFQMLRPDFQLPDRKTLCTTILDDCYEHVNGQLREKLDGTRYLNVTFDESTNINDDRILTMSFSTRDASYYYDSELFGDRRLTADEISEIVVKKLTSFLGPSPDWSRINSITTDTCSTMKAVWRILEQKPMFEHTFFVPCDSHGLQLVVKDLINLQAIKPIFDAAAAVVRYFRS